MKKIKNKNFNLLKTDLSSKVYKFGAKVSLFKSFFVHVRHLTV